ncbi:hypothetical protein ANN_04403 [Periplaneta americana]|uniref:Uncharacterized protein n=1 Tax=Periplaneta americana TaxID=6978 RepID=A0ABQ8T8H1_PERAM|nr:hypothetical protein ANN_04403 [Periplaneta americana]
MNGQNAIYRQSCHSHPLKNGNSSYKSKFSAGLKTVPGTRSVHCVVSVNGKLAMKPYSASPEVPQLVEIRRVTRTGRQRGNASRSDQQQ